MSRAVHLDIHASNPEAAIAFYGGLMPCRGDVPAALAAVNAFFIAIDVDADNIDTAAERSKAGGGLVRMPVPGIGRLARLKDPYGHIFGRMQADTAAA